MPYLATLPTIKVKGKSMNKFFAKLFIPEIPVDPWNRVI